MYVKILNSETYVEECYLFTYGMTSHGITPHLKKSTNFFDDEKEEISKCLENQGFEYEFFGDVNEREDKTKTKKTKVRRKKG